MDDLCYDTTNDMIVTTPGTSSAVDALMMLSKVTPEHEKRIHGVEEGEVGMDDFSDLAAALPEWSEDSPPQQGRSGTLRGKSVRCLDLSEGEVLNSSNQAPRTRIQCDRAILCYERCKRMSSKDFEFFTGITQCNFELLHDFLGGDMVCLHLKYKYNKKTPSKLDHQSDLTPKDRMFLTLLRLRRGIPLRDLAHVFNISAGVASVFFYTWIRFTGLEFQTLKEDMFLPAVLQQDDKPDCFQPFPIVRVILDATEFFVQQPTNFEQQSNTFSSYKHHNTAKLLVGISCYGGFSFVSEAFEGSISDKSLMMKSGIMDMLCPGDAVMTDRGFDIEVELNEAGVELLIPPFLGGRECFTPRELILSKAISSARVHVERAIGKIKEFRLVRYVIPNTL